MIHRMLGSWSGAQICASTSGQRRMLVGTSERRLVEAVRDAIGRGATARSYVPGAPDMSIPPNGIPDSAQQEAGVANYLWGMQGIVPRAPPVAYHRLTMHTHSRKPRERCTYTQPSPSDLRPLVSQAGLTLRKCPLFHSTRA